jgi:hypothetical protein
MADDDFRIKKQKYGAKVRKKTLSIKHTPYSLTVFIIF